jgi:hypothetical protein
LTPIYITLLPLKIAVKKNPTKCQSRRYPLNRTTPSFKEILDFCLIHIINIAKTAPATATAAEWPCINDTPPLKIGLGVGTRTYSPRQQASISGEGKFTLSIVWATPLARMVFDAMILAPLTKYTPFLILIVSVSPAKVL